MIPLTMIIHADSGNGKSPLALTGPKPILVVDTEQAAHHAHRVIDGEVEYPEIVKWNPVDPIPSECEDTCVVSITDPRQLDLVYKALVEQPHPFKTLVVDSITETQEQMGTFLRKETGLESFRQADWGVIKNRIGDFVLDTRNLVSHPTNPFAVIVYVALSRQRSFGDGMKEWPDISGSFVKNFPSKVDVCAYVQLKEDEEGVSKQGMLLHGNPKIMARTRSAKVRSVWGSHIINPNIEEIWKSIQPQENK